MGLFDFFNKKKAHVSESAQAAETKPVDKNLYVLLALESRLIEMAYEVKRHTQHLALVVNDELELGVMVVENPGNHPTLMHLMVSASHLKYFPKGIIESVVGMGIALEDQVNTALNNYINSTFLTIMDSFSDSHNTVLDFMTVSNGREVLWHPKSGILQLQGQWDMYPVEEYFFELLKDRIPDKLTANKINWLKIYISKRADGTIIGECLFNNENWPAGLESICNYAKTWTMPGEFHGLKQFIMFRRCDVYDDIA